MNRNNILLNIVGSLLCFIMLGVGMLFTEQVPLLFLVGIAGLSGASYFVSLIVTAIANQK